MTFPLFRRRRRNTTESASAVYLAVTTQPVGSTSPNLATQPVVAAKKSKGTTDTSYVTTVVPTLNVLTGSATLGGSEASGKACVAGVCTFTNLTVTAAAGATWTITFTSGTLTSATSNTGTTTASGATTIVSDTFTRADSAVSLGSTESGTAGVLAWTAQRGTWGISGNKAYLAVASAKAIATVPAGVSDCTVSLTYSTVSFGNAGLVFRYTDTSNYWAMHADGTSIYITKTDEAVVVQTITQAVVSGDVLSVVLSGTSIIAKLNGVQVGTTITDATDQTATKHGIRCDNWTGDRFDNFTVTVP